MRDVVQAQHGLSARVLLGCDEKDVVLDRHAEVVRFDRELEKIQDRYVADLDAETEPEVEVVVKPKPKRKRKSKPKGPKKKKKKKYLTKKAIAQKEYEENRVRRHIIPHRDHVTSYMDYFLRSPDGVTIEMIVEAFKMNLQAAHYVQRRTFKDAEAKGYEVETKSVKSSTKKRYFIRNMS